MVRFTQVDPAGMSAASLTSPQSLNMYAYVENDPVNSVDPSGVDPSSTRLMDQAHWMDTWFSAEFGGGGWGGGGAAITGFANDFGLRATFGLEYYSLPGYSNEGEQGLIEYELHKRGVPGDAEYSGDFSWSWWDVSPAGNDRANIATLNESTLWGILHSPWLTKSEPGLNMAPEIDPVMIGAGMLSGLLRVGAGVAVTETTSALVTASNAANTAAKGVGGFSVSAKHLLGSTGRYAKFNTVNQQNIQQIVKEALVSPNAIFKPNGNSSNSFIIVADLGRAVGSAGQTAVKVVFDNTGKIWTAYPVK